MSNHVQYTQPITAFILEERPVRLPERIQRMIFWSASVCKGDNSLRGSTNW